MPVRRSRCGDLRRDDPFGGRPGQPNGGGGSGRNCEVREPSQEIGPELLSFQPEDRFRIGSILPATHLEIDEVVLADKERIIGYDQIVGTQVISVVRDRLARAYLRLECARNSSAIF